MSGNKESGGVTEVTTLLTSPETQPCNTTTDLELDSKSAELENGSKDGSNCELPEGLDGGYSWVVLACALALQFMSVGITLSAGVLVVEFRDEFNVQPALASLMSSLNCGIAFGASPLGAFMSNKFSHRISLMVGCIVTSLAMVGSAFTTSITALVMTYGIVAGFGLALVYSPSISVVALYFNRRRSLVLGIVVAGGAAGSLAFPPILRWLMDQYSWRGAFIMLGGLTIQCCVFAALLVPVETIDKKYRKSQPIKETQRKTWLEITNYTLWFNPSFVLQFLNNLMWCLGIAPLWILLPDYARESNMSKTQGSFLISLLSLGNMLGRIKAALLMHFCLNMNRMHFHCITTIAGGIIIAMFPIKEIFPLFALLSFSVGLMFGALVGSLGVVAMDLYGVEVLTSAYSYLMLADGLGFAIGPPFAGWMFGISNSYVIPFIICGVLYSLSGLVLYATMCIRKRPPDTSEIQVKFNSKSTRV